MSRRVEPRNVATLSIPSSEGLPRIWLRRFDRESRAASDRPHLHNFFELVLIEEGQGSHAVDGQRIEVGEGDVMWIAPGQIHDPSGLEDTTKWILAFGADALLPGQSDAIAFMGKAPHLSLLPFSMAHHASPARAEMPKERRISWFARLRQIEQEIASRPLGYALAARALLELTMLDLTRLLDANSSSRVLLDRPFLDTVFSFIEANYHKPIGLVDVARAVGRSPAHLTDRVHRETGKTVLGWITERRMAEARRLLLHGGGSVDEVAVAVGYGDPKHFSRQFRKMVGMPPMAWRRASLVCRARAPTEKSDTHT